jgi:hypothetical protein
MTSNIGQPKRHFDSWKICDLTLSLLHLMISTRPMNIRRFSFVRFLVLVFASLLFGGVPSILQAADDHPTLSVTIGGKLVEMPDTSDATHGLDLSDLDVKLLYEADFTQPLRFIPEASLFSGDQRMPVPAGTDWVLEGKATARTEGGRLVLTNNPGHLVFWNTRQFPADVLIEFGVSPAHANEGLNILFFAAKGRDGGSIFDDKQLMRDGQFKTYHSGTLDCYHVSYWATDPNGQERGTSHIRKNYGFHIVAMGRDFIAGQGAGPHRVRVLKLGPDITVEVGGKIAVRWKDDGDTFGPVLGEGLIGLRQMTHTGECQYTYFKVHAVKPKDQ